MDFNAVDVAARLGDTMTALSERVAACEHISREFEKLHDEIPGLCVRISLTEKWQEAHPDTHRLEGNALSIAKAETDRRLHEMNQMRKQIDNERGTFVNRELYEQQHARLREDIMKGAAYNDAKIAELAKNYDAKIADLTKSRDTASGEQGFLEKFWPLIVAVAILVVQHFWK